MVDAFEQHGLAEPITWCRGVAGRGSSLLVIEILVPALDTVVQVDRLQPLFKKAS